MKATAAHIGFDRFIALDWAAAALRLRAGLDDLEALDALIDATHGGTEAKKKTRTVLRRLWLDPRPELADFVSRGVDLYRMAPDTPVSALCWGMAVAVYPFFARVAEIVGRLTALQGECTSTEVHRRMSELYGEREGTYRMTNMVLQTQASWGAIERVDNARLIIRKARTPLKDAKAIAWLTEAYLRHAGRPLSVAALDTMPINYPFALLASLSYVVSTAAALELHTDSGRTQLVSLKSGMGVC
jgi:hypothetical protein